MDKTVETLIEEYKARYPNMGVQFWTAAANHDILVASSAYPPAASAANDPIRTFLLSKLPSYIVDGTV